MERRDARLLVWENHARWVNRCEGIQLLRKNFDFRGRSTSISPSTMLAFVSDRPGAIAAVCSWRDPIRYALAEA